MNLRGYKVVNYSDWSSLPEIFDGIDQAKEAKSNWKYGKNAVIEYFNSKNKRVKTIRGE